MASRFPCAAQRPGRRHLAGLIWNGGNVLNSAWNEVRKVRESDRLLVLLESEASRLQNLIHVTSTSPNKAVFAEILRLHGEVLSTLRNRGTVDPVLSGSVDELRAVTERFLLGFGQVREVQAMIEQTYEGDVLKPAREMAGLYAIIEGAIGKRDALLWPSLGKVARGVHREPRRRQCLLSLARLGRGR